MLRLIIAASRPTCFNEIPLAKNITHGNLISGGTRHGTDRGTSKRQKRRDPLTLTIARAGDGRRQMLAQYRRNSLRD